MTALSASAMASRKASWSAVIRALKPSAPVPPTWMCCLPLEEARPMDIFFSAPPKPPMGWPLKWERMNRES